MLFRVKTELSPRVGRGGGLGLMNEILFRNDVDGFLTLKQFSFAQFCENLSCK